MEKMLRVKDIQNIIGCSLPKAYAIIKQSGFPSIRIGKNYYTSEIEFQKWVNRNLYKEIKL